MFKKILEVSRRFPLTLLFSIVVLIVSSIYAIIDIKHFFKMLLDFNQFISFESLYFAMIFGIIISISTKIYYERYNCSKIAYLCYSFLIPILFTICLYITKSYLLIIIFLVSIMPLIPYFDDRYNYKSYYQFKLTITSAILKSFGLILAISFLVVYSYLLKEYGWFRGRGWDIFYIISFSFLFIILMPYLIISKIPTDFDATPSIDNKFNASHYIYLAIFICLYAVLGFLEKSYKGVILSFWIIASLMLHIIENINVFGKIILNKTFFLRHFFKVFCIPVVFIGYKLIDFTEQFRNDNLHSIYLVMYIWTLIMSFYAAYFYNDLNINRNSRILSCILLLIFIVINFINKDVCTM